LCEFGILARAVGRLPKKERSSTKSQPRGFLAALRCSFDVCFSRLVRYFHGHGAISNRVERGNGGGKDGPSTVLSVVRTLERLHRTDRVRMSHDGRRRWGSQRHRSTTSTTTTHSIQSEQNQNSEQSGNCKQTVSFSMTTVCNTLRSPTSESTSIIN
jgi:hypothetical protein